MIKIIITDDQDIVREGLASLLQLREELDVIATARNGQEAFEKAKELEPDIVLMDIRMPVSNGVEGTKLITSSLPSVKVLMLTTFKDSALIAEALEEGASGYLLKDMSADTIVKAVMTVHSGGMVLPPELTAQMLNEWKREKQLKGINEIEKPNELLDLTEREIEVLAELGYGLNNKEIAEKLACERTELPLPECPVPRTECSCQKQLLSGYRLHKTSSQELDADERNTYGDFSK